MNNLNRNKNFEYNINSDFCSKKYWKGEKRISNIKICKIKST